MENSRQAARIPTGSASLDYMISLDGRGFHAPVSSPTSIMVEGGAGYGKSTLALQLAAHYCQAYAEQRVMALYFAIEESPNSIVERFRRFFQHQLPDVRCVTREHIVGGGKSADSPSVPAAGPADARALVVAHELELKPSEGNDTLIDFPPEKTVPIGARFDPDDAVRVVAAYWQYLRGRLGRGDVWPGMIILDSLNALQSRMEIEERAARAFLREVIGKQTENNYHAVLIQEIGRPPDFAEFLPEIIVSLDLDKGTGARYLTVSKARDHDCLPVRHDMEIRSPRAGSAAEGGQSWGVRTFPAPKAFLRRVTDREAQTPAAHVSTGLASIDDLLGQASRNSRTTASPILLLATGTSLTYQRLLAAKFLLEGYEKRQRSLWLHLGDLRYDPHEYLERLSEAKPGPPAAHPYPTDLVQRVELPLLSPGAILAGIDHHVGALSGERLVDRLVISDLSFMDEWFDEKTRTELASALGRVLQHLGVHTFALCTATSGSQDEFPEVARSVGRAFDRVLSVSEYTTSEGGPLLCGVSVWPTPPGQLRERIVQITYDPVHKSLLAEPGALSYLIRARPGEVAYKPLTIHQYEENTERLRRFSRMVEATVTVGFGGAESDAPKFERFYNEEHGDEPQVVPETIYNSLLAQPSEVPATRSDIVVFDEYWAPAFVEEEVLLPLNRFSQDLSVGAIGERWVGKALEPVVKGDGVYGLPYYGNFSCLCYRRDLIDRYWRDIGDGETAVEPPKEVKTKIGDDGSLNEPLTWDEVFSLGNYITERYLKDNPSGLIAPFALPLFSQECLSGFLLEILWPDIVAEDASRLQFRRAREAQELNKDLLGWQRSLTEALKLRAGRETAPLLLPSTPNHDRSVHTTEVSYTRARLSLPDPAPTPEFVFARSWYTMALDFLTRAPSGAVIGALPVPDHGFGKRQTQHLGIESTHTSLAGEWYVGVLANSINPGWATSVAKQMTQEQLAHQLHRLHAAVPLHNDFWLRRGALDAHVKQLYTGSRRRGQIRNYAVLSPELALIAERLLRPLTRREMQSQIGTALYQVVGEVGVSPSEDDSGEELLE